MEKPLPQPKPQGPEAPKPRSRSPRLEGLQFRTFLSPVTKFDQRGERTLVQRSDNKSSTRNVYTELSQRLLVPLFRCVPSCSILGRRDLATQQFIPDPNTMTVGNLANAASVCR